MTLKQWSTFTCAATEHSLQVYVLVVQQCAQVYVLVLQQDAKVYDCVCSKALCAKVYA